MEITQDVGPHSFRDLYSLFTEATESAQDLVDDALMVILQVCLQHRGQGMLLHPHLNPAQSNRGQLKVTSPIIALLEHALCFLFPRTFSPLISLKFSLTAPSKDFLNF